jgi:hypothetical protein
MFFVCFCFCFCFGKLLVAQYSKKRKRLAGRGKRGLAEAVATPTWGDIWGSPFSLLLN